MRVLLDEALPRRLGQHMSSALSVRTVGDCNWLGKKNGELLRLAEKEFDAFVTMDRGIEYQQNLANFKIAVILLRAPSNRLADLLPLIPNLEKALQSTVPGALKQVTSSGVA
jgi:predicted nuclease of predicted toxin-antitoxin system